MAAQQSTVPAALAGLVAAFKEAPGLEDAEVYDGPMVESSSSEAAVAVGFVGERMAITGSYPEPMGPVVSAQANLDDLNIGALAETYTVQSMAAVINGASDITAARAKAYELLAACGQAVAADKTLGGSVKLARMGGHTLSQDQTPRGAIATIVFQVECEAWMR